MTNCDELHTYVIKKLIRKITYNEMVEIAQLVHNINMIETCIKVMYKIYRYKDIFTETFIVE